MLPVYSDGHTSAAVTKYNILTGECSSLPSLPARRSEHACTVYKDHLVVSGGILSTSPSALVWQLEGDQWVELPSLRSPRYFYCLCTLYLLDIKNIILLSFKFMSFSFCKSNISDSLIFKFMSFLFCIHNFYFPRIFSLFPLCIYIEIQ